MLLGSLLGSSWLTLATSGLPGVGPAAHPAPGGEPVQVLFLGDEGHHQPRTRVAAALAPLHSRGIQIEYTEELGDLSRENLARFDLVAIYANIEQISPDQESSLLSFVREGGGLVALHCASYCFLNSEAYRDLVGARFSSHGTGTVQVQIEQPEHPLLAGFQPFDSWDETYVHSHHNAAGRTVLSVRPKQPDEPGVPQAEPWTWVREEGQGRVFYTAWGHDLRTWNQPGFQELIVRGMRWAAGREKPGEFPPPFPFEYLATETGIPDYVPGQSTGTRKSMQAPLSPEDSLTCLTVAPGLEARLFASEPLLLGKPIHLAFDDLGRAWILETRDYPNERRDEGGRDRIVILEDSDGDGRADKRQVFAEGLSIPTSLTFAAGGVVVVQAPDTLFLRDSDRDDVADESSVLFSGWGVGDTHAGPSNLRMGFDNRIWGTVGYSGFRGRVGEEDHSFSQAIFAFTPDGSKLEVIASTTNNTWGLGFNEQGCVFASTANGNPSVHAATFAGAYEDVPGLSPGALPTIADRIELHPVTDRVRQVDWHGQYTAAAGHAIYTARTLPERYWNRIAFVNSPTGHLVGQFALEHRGSDYVAKDAWNLVASRDEWTAPVLSEVGPDGAVWVIDWYNYIVQHNPTPPGFETGRGNAYVSELRDKQRGRIWRVIPTDSEPPSIARLLEEAKTNELVAALREENLLWRQHAQRRLVEAGDAAAVPSLLELLADPRIDRVGNDPGSLHALWALDGLGAFASPASLNEDQVRACEDALVASLRSEAWGVRRAALRLLPEAEWARDLLLTSGVLGDEHSKVRAAALLALAKMPKSREAGVAAFEALERAQDDPWLAQAATLAGARHDTGFLRALLTHARSFSAPEGQERATPSNSIANPSFEDGSLGWRVRHYGGEASQGVVEDAARTGRRSLRLSSETGADTSYYYSVAVDPNATYRLRGWIRTSGLKAGSGRGAQFNVHELQSPEPVRTVALTGDTDWQAVEVVFETQGRKQITINCLLGGWGWSQGEAWFDDISLEKLSPDLLTGQLGASLRVVLRSYAQRGPVDSVVGTFSRLTEVSPDLATFWIESLAQAWPETAPPHFGAADLAGLRSLSRQLASDPREALAELLGIWKVTVEDALDLNQILAQLRERLGDPKQAEEQRIQAAERWIRLTASEEATRTILAELTPTTPPSLACGLLRALEGQSRDAVGEEILGAWDRYGPQARVTAASILLRRDAWTIALLNAIALRDLPSSVLRPVQWSQLRARTEPPALVRSLEAAQGASANTDRLEVVRLFLPVLDQMGDPSLGKAVFAQQCATCHRHGGQGRRLGPDLDGIHARAPEELLIAILDPNRDVEGTYQVWTARTRDGFVTSGRLAAETRSSIELLDAEGNAHLLERSELEQLVASPNSLMPSGLETALGEQGLRDLLAYLREPQHP